MKLTLETLAHTTGVNKEWHNDHPTQPNIYS